MPRRSPRRKSPRRRSSTKRRSRSRSPMKMRFSPKSNLSPPSPTKTIRYTGIGAKPPYWYTAQEYKDLCKREYGMTGSLRDLLDYYGAELYKY